MIQKGLATTSGLWADTKQLGRAIGSSEFYGALKEAKASHALAGGATGMVANAGYNYATDQEGGYMGSALVGGVGGVAGMAAWKSAGKELAHSGTQKLKNTVMTDGGTKAFKVREYGNDQFIKTKKNGDFDLVGQQKLVSDLETKLKNADPTSSGYDSLVAEHRKAVNGLDHMQSVRDNREAQTKIGAQNLKQRYSDAVEAHKNQDGGRLHQQLTDFNSLSGQRKHLKTNLDKAISERNKARDALDTFKKSKGNMDSDEGKRLASALNTANHIKDRAGRDYGSFLGNNGQRLSDLGNQMNSPEMVQYKNQLNYLQQKKKAASDLVSKYSSSKKSVLNSVQGAVNMSM